MTIGSAKSALRYHRRIILPRLLGDHRGKVRNLQIRLPVPLGRKAENETTNQPRPLAKARHPAPSEMVPCPQEREGLACRLGILDFRRFQLRGRLDEEVDALAEVAQVFQDHVPCSGELVQSLEAPFVQDFILWWRVHVHAAVVFVL